jgi:hypothetical protein
MKIKVFKSRLSKVGFILLCGRGKESQNIWRHFLYPVSVVQSGEDNSDANLTKSKRSNLFSRKLTLQTQIKQNHDPID